LALGGLIHTYRLLSDESFELAASSHPLGSLGLGEGDGLQAGDEVEVRELFIAGSRDIGSGKSCHGD
jgi:hypothetical protein